MDVQDVYLLLFWLLPGMVLGVIGTLMIQQSTGQCVSPKKVKVDTKITGDSQRDDDINIVLTHELYLSSTGRVHKTPHCSNMKSCQKVQVCCKCFKIE